MEDGPRKPVRNDTERKRMIIEVVSEAQRKRSRCVDTIEGPRASQSRPRYQSARLGISRCRRLVQHNVGAFQHRVARVHRVPSPPRSWLGISRGQLGQL